MNKQQFDPSLYDDDSDTPTNSSFLARKSEHQPDNANTSVISIGVVAVLGMAVAASMGSAVPSMMQQYRTNEVVAQRLQANGLTVLEGSELEEAIKVSIPLTDNTGKLLAVRWETVINNNDYPPGSYLTANSVIVKRLNGAKTLNDSGNVAGHGFANIPPETALKRLTEYLRKSNQILGF